jgi:hypothetical protein
LEFVDEGGLVVDGARSQAGRVDFTFEGGDDGFFAFYAFSIRGTGDVDSGLVRVFVSDVGLSR